MPKTELWKLFVLQVNDRPSQASTHGNLAVAYQALGAHDRALQHYLHHLTISRELRDTQSEARALGKRNEKAFRTGGAGILINWNYNVVL